MIKTLIVGWSHALYVHQQVSVYLNMCILFRCVSAVLQYNFFALVPLKKKGKSCKFCFMILQYYSKWILYALSLITFGKTHITLQR